MITSFDAAAANYDALFTNSVTGRMQRDVVRTLFCRLFSPKTDAVVLEINCGTGDDALWLAGLGYQVTATDISPKMIAVARSKSARQNPDFTQADIRSLRNRFANDRFNIVFSNFGGLNCLSPMELQRFFSTMPSMMDASGRLALVIMPRWTLWENAYFMLKGDFKSAFRRRQKSVIANVDGQQVLTFYYNPSEIIRMAKSNFRVHSVRPVGLFAPPSYLEKFISRHRWFAKVLATMERAAKYLTALAPFADHYLIVLEKR